jgi:hypothetical protein
MAQTKTSNRGNTSSKSSGTRSKNASRNGSSKSSSTRAGASSRNGSDSGSGSSRSTKTASRTGSKASSTARKTSTRARNTGNSAKDKANSAKDKAKSAKDTVSDGAQTAVESVGETVGDVVDKVKLPLVAGGAALAGLAGAAVVAAVTRSGRRKKVLGVKLPKQGGLSLPKPSVSFGKRNGFKGDTHRIASAVTDAAKRADKFGQNVSKVATSVQNVSETADQAVKKA